MKSTQSPQVDAAMSQRMQLALVEWAARVHLSGWWKQWPKVSPVLQSAFVAHWWAGGVRGLGEGGVGLKA